MVPLCRLTFTLWITVSQHGLVLSARRMNVYWSVQVLFPCQLSFFSRKPFFPPSTLPLISLLVHNRFIWLIRVTPSVNAVLAGLAAPQVCSCDRRQCSVIVIAFSHSFIRKRSRLRIVTWSAIRWCML